MAEDIVIPAHRAQPRPWHRAAAGLSALLLGIGFSRFGFAPLIPALIQAHWFGAADAAYLGAANLMGYLIGAAAALHERYGRLDALVGNAAIAGVPSPLDHIEPKAWDESLAINLTANWHLIRAMNPLLRLSAAGRAVFITSGVATSARAYWAPYSVSKAALDALVRTYAEETSSTNVRVNLFNPGPTRTRMRALAMPGEDPAMLPAPDEVAAKIADLCLPDFSETGKLYDFRAGKLLEFVRPA